MVREDIRNAVDLTTYERNLVNRFRSALFDIEDEQADTASLIDPEHPEYPAFLAIGFPPVKRKKPKRETPIKSVQETLW